MTDTDLLRRILGAMHVGPPGPADISWLAVKGLHALEAIEAEARQQEREALAERIETIEHPCHEVCVPNHGPGDGYAIHADCQCAAFVRESVLSILRGTEG